MNAKKLFNVLVRITPPLQVSKDKDGSFVIAEKKTTPYTGFNLKWKELTYLIYNGSDKLNDLTQSILAHNPLRFSVEFSNEMIICEFIHNKYNSESLSVTLQKKIDGQDKKKVINLLKKSRSHYGNLTLLSQENL